MSKIDLIQGCTYYTVDTSELSPETIELMRQKGFDFETEDTHIMVDGCSIALFDISKYDYGYLDEDDLEDILESYVGKHSNYLVFARGCRWNGASGYKFTTNLLDAVTRSYENSIYYKGHIQDIAYICTETSHDVPTGSTTAIIGLSTKKLEELQEANFEEIEEFAMQYIREVN